MANKLTNVFRKVSNKIFGGSLFDMFLVAAAGSVIIGSTLAAVSSGSVLAGIGTALCGVFGAAAGTVLGFGAVMYKQRNDPPSNGTSGPLAEALAFGLLGFVGGTFAGTTIGYNLLTPDDEQKTSTQLTEFEENANTSNEIPLLEEKLVFA